MCHQNFSGFLKALSDSQVQVSKKGFPEALSLSAFKQVSSKIDMVYRGVNNGCVLLD
jgi:hypothetical protein